MKAVFLDIDGVVNSSGSVFAKVGGYCIDRSEHDNLVEAYGSLAYGANFALRTMDPICAELVSKLLDESKAKLVLSSTHRMHFADGGYGSEEHLKLLRIYLRAMRIRVPEHFDITKRLHKIRGDEVREYLDRHPEIEDHVILDDSADFHSDQPLVMCDATYGFSFANYVEACKTLAISGPGTILL